MIGEQRLMRINYYMWITLTQHYMYFFMIYRDRQTNLLIKASEAFDFIMKRFYSPEQIQEYYVLGPNIALQKHYKLVFMVIFLFD